MDIFRLLQRQNSPQNKPVLWGVVTVFVWLVSTTESAYGPGFTQNQAPRAKNGQNGSIVPEISVALWEHLNSELDKGKDVDDPGKILRFWIKTVGGHLSQPERQQIVALANRHATRRALGADTELYTTMLAGLLLKFDEQRQMRQSEAIDAGRRIDVLHAQNQVISQVITELKAQINTQAEEAVKAQQAAQSQNKELRAQIDSLRQQIKSLGAPVKGPARKPE